MGKFASDGIYVIIVIRGVKGQDLAVEMFQS